MGCVILAIVLGMKPVLLSLFDLFSPCGKYSYFFSGFLGYNKSKGVLVSDEQALEPLNFKSTLKRLFPSSICHSVFRLISVFFVCFLTSRLYIMETV